MAEHGPHGKRSTANSLPWPERQPDFEQERVLTAARRGLFDRIPTAPTMIGRYRIDRRVGAGGMGEVYVGLDTELQRSVAIKLVLPHISSAFGPQRLRREARALARLSHPNVVQVYEVGEHEGRTFLAMELIEGETLAGWLAARRRGWPEILEHFMAAGRGLAAAHAAGIIHRDFKPENVPMTREGRVCVADFGLASTAETIPSIASNETTEPVSIARLSTTGAVLGTVRYMPLEQLRGEVVDTRADQFAFCVALYEALWGVSPFPATTVAERQLALETTTATLPPRGPTPRGLWKVLRKGLSRDPARRWPDMAALVAALEAVPRRRRGVGIGVLLVMASGPMFSTALAPAGAEVPVDPCGETEGLLAEDWNSERRRALVGAFGATGQKFAESAAVATASVLDDWSAHWLEERRALCRATVEELLPSELLRLRGACLEEQHGSFAETVESLLDADAVAGADVARLLYALPSILPEPRLCHVEQGLLSGLHPLSIEQAQRVASLRRTIARSQIQVTIGRRAEAKALIEPVLAEAEALGYRPLLAEALTEWSRAVFELRDPMKRVEVLERAVDLAEASNHDHLAARIWATLAELGALYLRDHDRGTAWLRRAVAAHERVGGSQIARTRLEYIRFELAMLVGDLDAAESAIRTTLHILDRQDLGFPAPFIRLAYLEGLARVVEARGRPREALALRREILAGAEVIEEVEPMHVGNLAFGLAQSLVAEGSSVEATVLLERAAMLWLSSDLDDEYMLGYALLAQTQVALADGNLEQAQQRAQDASRILARHLPPEHPDQANASMAVGVVAHQRGDYLAAVEAFDWAIEALETDTGSNDPTVMLLYANKGASLMKLHRWDEARVCFELALRAGCSGPHEPIALHGLAMLDLRGGKPIAAKQRLDDFEEIGGERLDLLWDVEPESGPTPALVYKLVP